MPEIRRRVRNAWGKFTRYKRQVFRCRSRWLSLKLRLLKSEVVEVLLYGCNAWTLSQEAWTLLQKAHRSMLHIITGHRASAHDGRRRQSYHNLLLQTECEPIETTVRTRRLLLLGELVRQNDARIPKRMLFAELDHGKRSVGKPRPDWVSDVKGDMSKFDIDSKSWLETAKDGPKWRNLVEKQASHCTKKWHAEEEKKHRARRTKEAQATATADPDPVSNN